MGRPDYFLDLEVKYQANGSLILTQDKYIRYLIHNASMTDCKGIVTPMAFTTKLNRFGSDRLHDPHTYSSLVGALQYFTFTVSFCIIHWRLIGE